jgi:hypothetical protein
LANCGRRNFGRLALFTWHVQTPEPIEIARGQTTIQTHIHFIVEYADGSSARMTIDGSLLDEGDVSRVIAAKRQQVGELPEGKIKSIRRDPPG